MQTLKSYLFGGSNDVKTVNDKPDYRRAYRETYIHQIINTFETEAFLQNGTVGLAGYRKQPLPFNAKCRTRNEIIRKIAENAKTHADDPDYIYSAEAIQEAFFDTIYGRKYDNETNRARWNNLAADVDKVVRSWTYDRVENNSFKKGKLKNGDLISKVWFPISPYDPAFSDSMLFDDDEDNLIICGGNVKSSEFGTDIEAVHVDKDPNVTVMSGFSTNEKILRAGFPNGLDTRTRMNLYSGSNMVAFGTINRFIKKENNRRDIESFLSDPDLRQMTADENKFITDVCNLLSENGVEFDIDIKSYHGNKQIYANLGGRRQIRLYDADEPIYQGRIYDNGNIVYTAVDQQGMNRSEQDVRDHIAHMNQLPTSEDRINMVKYYLGLGNTPNVQLEGLDNVEARPVGVSYLIKDSKKRFYGIAPRHASDNKDTKYTVKRRKDKDGVKTAITLSTKLEQYGSYNNLVVVNMVVEPDSRDSLAKESALKELQFNKQANGYVSKFLYEVSDASSYYPDDVIEDTITFREGDSISGRILTNQRPIAEARRPYYEALYCRGVLSSWVDAAKAYHSELVNIDDIVTCFKENYDPDNGYEYHYSGDENIAEIQKLYWDLLVGKKNIGKSKNKSSDLDGFDDADLEGDIDAKTEAIKRHYNNYLDNKLGRVPEIMIPDDPDASPEVRQHIAEMQREIAERNVGAGFDPTFLAQYMYRDLAYGFQHNFDDIRHALMRMGDFYSPEFMKDDSYMSMVIKNDMIKYNPETAAVQSVAGGTTGHGVGIHLYDAAARRILTPDELYARYEARGGLDRGIGVAIQELHDNLDGKNVTKDMLYHTAKTLYESGCNPESIEINVDDNGIISYYGLMDSESAADKVKYDRVVSGQIGQVFEPDENGVIIPKYVVDDSNKVIVPGYNAYLVVNDPNDPKPMRDRLRLVGWEQQMKQAITQEIRKSALGDQDAYNYVPHTSSLNNVYKHAYDTKMTLDEYMDKLDASKSSPEEVATAKAVINTLKGRCRFPNEYGEGSTTAAQSMLEHPERDESKRFDFYYSDLCDNHNLRVLDESFDGIFDPDATGTAKTQGIVRYLAENVRVDTETGKPIAIEDYDPDHPPKCALTKDRMMSNLSFNAWDRGQMAFSQLLTALRTPSHCGVAMMNLKGDTFDDGFTVSKAFAERCMIKDPEGNPRPLIPQDKLSDKNGNKGVITRVVDPEEYKPRLVMHLINEDCIDLTNNTVTYKGRDVSFKVDPSRKVKTKDGRDISIAVQAAEAVQKEFLIDDDICKVFAENKNLDIVMSPYSGMSRHNGGTIRDLMQNPDTLKVNGKTVKGGMGYMDMIVVDMPADVKTHFYGEDDIREGKGRRASGQFIWALNSKGADKIMDELFGSNNKAWDNLREYAVAIGLDVNEKMEPVIGYHEQSSRGEHRRLFELPSDEKISKLELRTNGGFTERNANIKKVRKDMLAEINKQGGFIELPFKLNFNLGKYTHLSDSKLEGTQFLFDLRKTGNVRAGEETYGLPVLSSKLRSGQDFKDGSARTHDYTAWYMSIYNDAVEYMKCKEELNKPDSKMNKDMLNQRLTILQNSAQESLDKIVGDIVDKQFNTKYNVFREECMSARIPSSATAVISAGISLKADEVAMSEESATKLGLMSYNEESGKYEWSKKNKNREVLIWRDPILKDGNIRCMRVQIDNSVKGIRINPAMGKSFDGDFDGDSYGVAVLKTNAAKQQAHSLFHVSNNLLNTDDGRDPKTGFYPLYINSGMDMTAVMCADKTGKIKETYDKLVKNANLLHEVTEGVRAGKMDINSFEYETIVYEKKRNKDGSESKRPVKDANGDPVPKKNPDGSYVMETVKGMEAVKKLKADCMFDLDIIVKESFNGIATDHIVVENVKTTVDSLQNIVDSGAKGNQSKMTALTDNVGITYDYDENGRPIPETAKNITHIVDGKEVPCSKIVKESETSGKNYLREKNKQIQETAAYKADNTQLGGVTAQNFIAAHRNYHPKEVLGISSKLTQGILDAKHNPEEAKAKDHIARHWYKDVLEGYKVTGSWHSNDPDVLNAEPHEKISVQAYSRNGEPLYEQKYLRDKNGAPMTDQPILKLDVNNKPIPKLNPVKCTRDEWVEQMIGVHTALNVDVNKEYIETLADAMVIPGDPERHVYGMTEFTEKHGSLMDKVAYAGRLTALVKTAMLNDPDAYAVVGESLSKQAQPGSLIGNAVETAPKEYACVAELKKADLNRDNDSASDYAKKSDELRRKLLEEKERSARSTDACGQFIPNSIGEQLFGDEERKKTGFDKNLVYTKSGIKEVDPIPCGRNDSRLTRAEYEAVTCRVMGETTQEYEARKNTIRVVFDETEEKVSQDTVKKSLESLSESVEQQSKKQNDSNGDFGSSN